MTNEIGRQQQGNTRNVLKLSDVGIAKEEEKRNFAFIGNLGMVYGL